MASGFDKKCQQVSTPFFNPEGLPREALNFYSDELHKLFDNFKHSKPYQKTSSRGYFDYYPVSKYVTLTDSSINFIKKLGIASYNQYCLTNLDGKHKLIIIMETSKNLIRFLRSYCSAVGYKLETKNKSAVLLVTEISTEEPSYDSRNDPQYLNLPIDGLNDLLTFFPDQAIANREDKQKSFLFSLVGAQEKKFSRGGIGVSILASQPTSMGADKLILNMSRDWFPSCSRGVLSPSIPSFLTGYYSNFIPYISRDAGNLLRLRVNRDIIQPIPNLERNPAVLSILSYTHSYVYLDEPADWLESSNAVHMLLHRARLTRVSYPNSIIEEAKTKERNISEKFYEEFNRYYRIPEAVLDLAECIAKLNGKMTVSSRDLTEAEDIIYRLRKESADEIGEKAKLFSPEYRYMRREVKAVHTIIGIYGDSIPKDGIKEKALAKGLKESEFENILEELKMQGEVYESPVDGVIFLKLANEKFI